MKWVWPARYDSSRSSTNSYRRLARIGGQSGCFIFCLLYTIECCLLFHLIFLLLLGLCAAQPKKPPLPVPFKIFEYSNWARFFSSASFLSWYFAHLRQWKSGIWPVCEILPPSEYSSVSLLLALLWVLFSCVCRRSKIMAYMSVSVCVCVWCSTVGVLQFSTPYTPHCCIFSSVFFLFRNI